MMETFLAKVASQEPAQTTEKLPGPRCFCCQRPGHFQRDCKKRKAEERKKSQSGKRARAALGVRSAAEEDGRATSPAVGKPHRCSSIGPLGTRSFPQECCGQGRGAGCIGCIAPRQAQGQPGSNQGCCPNGNGHSGCLLHKALPGCCPWRAVVMAIFGATGSCGELCPGFRDLLGRLLLARWGTNGVGLASHPLGGAWEAIVRQVVMVVARRTGATERVASMSGSVLHLGTSSVRVHKRQYLLRVDVRLGVLVRRHGSPPPVDPVFHGIRRSAVRCQSQGLRDLSLPSPQAAALIVPQQGNPACQEGQLKSRQSWEPGK